MEPGNDSELKRLLDEWQVPNAPDGLAQRVFRRRGLSWRTLVSTRVRVPLPIAVAFCVALIWLTIVVVHDRTSALELPDLRGFQPVKVVNVRIERSGDATTP